MRIERIVVGVDGSDNAHHAVTWAAALAAAVGAEVLAVHAVGLLEHLADDGEAVPAEQHRQELADTLSRQWCAPLLEAGVAHRAELRDGNPVSVLLAAGDDVDADILVVGSRGLGGYPELLLGSTSTQVAQHAHRPVLIVPADTVDP